MATRKSYECSVCKKIFNCPSALETHFRVHTGQKPFPCQYCGEVFSQNYNLRQHINSVHYGERPHKCPYCGNDFAQKSNLSAHIKRVHNGGKLFTCQFCGMVFALIHNLAVHVHTKHDGRHMCSKCGSTFVDKSIMKGHRRNCEGGPSRDFSDFESYIA